MPEAAENAHRLTVTGRVCRYVKIGCALVFDAVAAYGLFKLTQPHFFFKSLRRALKKRWAYHSVREQKAYKQSPFCELCRASKKKGARFMFLYSISKNSGP